jgi:hypothetical protein
MQLRADALDEVRGSAKIAPLIASHQCLEIAVRVHELECLLAIFISAGVFAQSIPRCQVHSRTHFSLTSRYSMESGQKLREAK